MSVEYSHENWERTYITYTNGTKKEFDHFDFSRFGNLEDIVKIEYQEAYDQKYLRPLDERIGKCINLEVLDVGGEHGTAINSLPECISNCTKLRYISANGDDGPMEEYSFVLPESIGELKNLEKLNLWCSNIKSFPESIGNCINLKKFFAPCNKLTSLPESIGNLVNLKVLNCHLNKLTSLPESLLNLRNLEELDFDENPLNELPVNIRKFIDRIQNKQSVNYRVYNDSQNVHNSMVNNSVKSSITEILKEKPLESFLEKV